MTDPEGPGAAWFSNNAQDAASTHARLDLVAAPRQAQAQGSYAAACRLHTGWRGMQAGGSREE
jgi:hypothetical protein